MSIPDTDDLFADYYGDYYFQAYPRSPYPGNATVSSDIQSWTSLSRPLLAILLRVGFVLLQVGSVPVNNINLILLHNIVDFSCVNLVYFLLGFVVAYNGDTGGLVGGGRWIGDYTSDEDEALIGWHAVLVASSICSSGVVGRTHTVGYLVVAVLLSGLLEPLLVHWIWTPKGWMANSYLNGKKVFFRDQAGSATVHMVGGLGALIGCMTLGRRILRLRDLDEASISSSSSSTAFTGQLLIFVGLLGSSLPNYKDGKPKTTGRYMGRALVNNLLAGSSCSLLVVALHFILNEEAFNHWTVMRCAQGVVSGLVVVSAGANVYSPLAAIALGCLGGAAFYLISKLVLESALEDYCNVVATHLVCGLLGSFLAPLCAIYGDSSAERVLLSFSWQLICLATIIPLATIVFGLAFGLLEFFGVLRNRSEYSNHLRAEVALERGPPRKFAQRLFSSDGDTVYLQPGTTLNVGYRQTVGPRFWRYQTEVDELEQVRMIAQDVPKTAVKLDNRTVQVSDVKIKKLRQIHTLPAHDNVLINYDEVIGEFVNSEIPLEDARKIDMHRFKCKMVGREAGVEFRNKMRIGEGCSDDRTFVRTNINNKNHKGACDRMEEEKSANEAKYRLRRTLKSMNLREELDQQNSGVRILLTPKHEDSCSSDSQEDNSGVQRILRSVEFAANSR